MKVTKTFSFADVRVVNKLEEVKGQGGNMSQYISQLILADIRQEQNKFSVDEVMAMIGQLVNKDEVVTPKQTKQQDNVSDLIMSVLGE